MRGNWVFWLPFVRWIYEVGRNDRHERIRRDPHRDRGDESSRPDGGGKLIHIWILRSLAEMHAGGAYRNVRHDSDRRYMGFTLILI